MSTAVRDRRACRVLQLCSALTLAAVMAPVAAAEPGVEASPTKQQCADAYVAGQVARKQGKLRQAEAEWRTCAQASCAEFVRRDCARWGDEVRAAIPSLAFDVRDALGVQISDAIVEIDGVVAEGAAAGLAIAVDPGRHRVVARTGDRRVEQDVIAIEGGRAQRVALTLPVRERLALPQTPQAASAVAAPRPDRPSYVAPAIAGAIAVVGLGGFVGFGLAANAAEDDARLSCMNMCNDETVRAIWRKQVAADASLAVGVVAAGVAGWLLWQRRGHEMTPDLALVSGGALASVGGRW